MGHRLRWIVVWVAVALWFAGLAVNAGGNGVHLLLLLAIVVLLYELMV